jgi:D-cysteine desulfhydrase
MADPALFEFLPALKGRVPFVQLGDWPTPLEPLKLAGLEGREVFVKREDISARAYGGNKVRTLETLLGEAMQNGCKRVWSTGAYGSNHALAAALHSRGLNLASAALLFPQPAMPPAAENMQQLISLGVHIHALRTIVTFPFRLAGVYARARAQMDYVMLPGGAVPLGALGHVGAAFELAQQVKEGKAVWPRHVLVACGSTCTAAGILTGLFIARKLGLCPEALPRVHALRVTPWPVTAAGRIAGLAHRTAKLIAQFGGPQPVTSPRGYRSILSVHGRYLGWGYGKPTRAGEAAIRAHSASVAFPLETTYSAKAVAGLLDLTPFLDGPVVFWSTKSGSTLPKLDTSRLASTPAHVRRWLMRAGMPLI